MTTRLELTFAGVTALLATPMSASAQKAAIARPFSSPGAKVDLILDTDLGIDVDDAGALHVALALEHFGIVNLLAVMHSAGAPWGAGAIDAITSYWKRPDKPIGAYKGPVGASQVGRYTRVLAEDKQKRWPHDVVTHHQVPEATELYRRILHRQPDHSVRIVTTGYFTNIANLVQSKKGAHGVPLSGVDLIKRKVVSITSMAGQWPRGWEHNFAFDINSTQTAIHGWPREVPMVFSPGEVGGYTRVGALLAYSDPRNPVREAYRLHQKGFSSRPSWDLAAVLCAVFGPVIWRRHGPGTNRVVRSPHPGNQFHTRQDSNHYMIQRIPAYDVLLQALLNEILMLVPGR